MRRARRAVALVFAVALATGACSKSDSGGGEGSGGGTPVTIKNLTFSPATLTAASGQALTISVTNNDSVEHSFTLDDGSASRDIEAGESQTLTVTLSATTGWHCTYHPTMTGTITVA